MSRLIMSVTLALLSLLTVFRAPSYSLWKLAITVTQYPHFFMAAALVLLVSSYWAQRFKGLVFFFSSFSLVLFSLPVVSAWQQGCFVEKNDGLFHKSRLISFLLPGKIDSVIK